MSNAARYIGIAAGLLAVTAVTDYLVPWSANKGLPFVFVKQAAETQGHAVGPEFSLSGFAGRAAAYLLLASVALLVARLARVSDSYQRQGLWLVVATTVSWLFWFVLDPIAVTLLLPQSVLEPWSGVLNQHFPAWAEIYSGWGYARYFWWLVGIHWCALLGLMCLIFRKRTATQPSDPS